jgi:phage gp36-like protein
MSLSQYATEQQFRDLGLPSSALEEVTSGMIDLHLQMASGFADSFLANRYPIPISPTPSALVRCVIDIAVYELLLRRGYNPETYDTQYRTRYEDAKSWLEAIYNRDADLPGVSEIPTDTATGNARAPRVLTRPERGWYDD